VTLVFGARPRDGHGLADFARERWGTAATAVTAVRTALAVALGLAALTASSGWPVLAGYVAYRLALIGLAVKAASLLRLRRLARSRVDWRLR